MDVTPALILAMWTAGMAAGAALVSYWAIVGTGYGWLLSAVVVIIGGVTALAGDVTLGVVATVAALGAGIMAGRHRAAAILFGVAALCHLVVAIDVGGVLPAVTGTLLLGAMTSEMLLGHWFLVDPQLPRWALQRLAQAAGVGLVLDVGVVAALGAFTTGDTVMIAALAALVGLTALLTAGVWYSLKEPGYSGVMAATGLSYLGVLTTFGVVVIGRILLIGL